MSAPTVDRTEVTPPPGFWQREISHVPQPITPMSGTSMKVAVNGAFRRLFAEMGALIETIEFEEIDGWVYTRVVPLGDKDRKAPPPLLFGLLARLMPAMRARLRRARTVVRDDHFGRYLDRWFAELRPALEARIAELRSIALTELGDDELVAHVRQVDRWLAEAMEIHFTLHGTNALFLGDLAFCCRDLLGWEDSRTMGLLVGLSEASTEVGEGIRTLAAMAAVRPRLVRLLLLSPADASSSYDPARLAETDPEFAAAFETYRHRFGCRAIRYELVDPTLEESPELLLRLVADQLERPSAATDHQARRDAVEAEARATLAGRPADLARFDRALSRAQRFYGVREDNEYFTVSAPLAVLRFAVLEVGRRLAERAVLAGRDDVFLLELEEALAVLRSGQPQRELVEHRGAQRRRQLATEPPNSYGTDPGPPPSFAYLPKEARFVNEAMLWLVDRIFEQQRSLGRQSGGSVLTGLAASPGRVTGPARVVLSEAEFAKLRPGDVLVCPITSPVWSVLFPSVAALVTDTGGVLSHPAIIAREFGVPAVVATGNATRLVKDGQTVTVDGAAGTVELH